MLTNSKKENSFSVCFEQIYEFGHSDTEAPECEKKKTLRKINKRKTFVKTAV